MATPAIRASLSVPTTLRAMTDPKPVSGTPHILLIDCDPTTRSRVKGLLRPLGSQVREVESGAAGLAEASSRRYDLVIVASVQDNGADGADICRRVKALTRTQVVPVLAYATSFAPPDIAEGLYQAGCDALVLSDQFETLDRVVEALIEGRTKVLELDEQNRILEMENRRLEDRRQRAADGQAASGGAGSVSLLMRDLAAGLPDGVLIADSRGIVLHADRGACEILGALITGRTLGSVAPATGLEAFVRDARAEPRDGFRFEVSARKDRMRRSILASVTPIAASGLDASPTRRVVLLLDVEKRRLRAADLSGARAIPMPQLGSLLEAAHAVYTPQALEGCSRVADQMRRRVIESAGHKRPILLLGERGTGKELTARILHYASTATGPFLQLRCGSLSAESVESELFGYAKGAFPGAVADRPGLVLLSRDGSLYLNEVGDLPLDLQRRLLEAIEKGTVRRRGARRRDRFDCRLIASSSQDLEALVAEGRFLPELQRRLALNVIGVPRLCDRIEDLPQLTDQFLARFGRCGQVSGLAEDALWVMQQHNWPGNVSELEDCIERACARVSAGPIEVAHLTRPLRDLSEELPAPELIPSVRPSAPPGHQAPTRARTEQAPPGPLRPWDITEDDPISLEFYERQVLIRSLHESGGDKLEAARLLKVGKSTLYRKLQHFGIK